MWRMRAKYCGIADVVFWVYIKNLFGRLRDILHRSSIAGVFECQDGETCRTA